MEKKITGSRKNRFWKIFFLAALCAGVPAYFFRFQALHWIQGRLLQSIEARALISNRNLFQDSLVSSHKVYSLKGLARLWPHRVNSLRRFTYLYSGFAGFECYIRFDDPSGKLYVTHDDPDGLVFSDFLEHDPDHKLFWLDLKNLSPRNLVNFCRQLDIMDREFTLRNRIILEVYDTAVALQIGERGYLNCLNISGMRRATDGNGGLIPDRAERYFPHRIRLFSEEFGMDREGSLELPNARQLTWDIGFWHGMNRRILLDHANDSSLLVCLINVKSPGYR
jgi:hypothetical protein